MDPDEALSVLPLNRDETKTALILAVGLWVTAVEVLNTGPVVASAVVGAFAASVGYFLLEKDEL